MKNDTEMVKATSFVVFNETDGILASPGRFSSRKEARRFIESFRARYREQGFYLTARGERISPAHVLLSIEAVDVENSDTQGEPASGTNGGDAQ